MTVLWLALAPLASATSIDEVDDPRARGSWVTDEAGILDAAAERRLDDRIDALHADLDVEIAVVTLQDVDGTPKEFATGLFNHWGIGDEQANNGLLVLLVTGERRLEMETGYGLEPVLPDGWLGTMQQQAMVPLFKRGDYAGGLEAGLARVDAKLRGSPEESREGTRSEPDLRVAAVVGAGSIFGFGGVAVGLMLFLRRRDRTCPKCDLYMPMLDEEADDEHLDAGQQAEERLGSVNYMVHRCPQCDDIRTFERARWFSGFSRCPECRARTRKTTSRTLRYATHYSGGLVEITEDCKHCSYHRRYNRSTPRLPPPSSTSSSGGFSSSGGGGSFGGGSSGGGGAGSSW